MFVLLFAEILHMAVLYQLEIIIIWVSNDIYHFEFPFYIGGSISVWVARDFWYLMDFISRILVYIGLYNLMTTILLYRYKMKISLISYMKHSIYGRYGKEKDRYKK